MRSTQSVEQQRCSDHNCCVVGTRTLCGVSPTSQTPPHTTHLGTFIGYCCSTELVANYSSTGPVRHDTLGQYLEERSTNCVLLLQQYSEPGGWTPDTRHPPILRRVETTLVGVRVRKLLVHTLRKLTLLSLVSRQSQCPVCATIYCCLQRR